jgi:SHS2 domain-containing protein
VGTFLFFDHMADVGMTIRAESPADLFLTAGLGLMTWMGVPPATHDECESDAFVAASDIDSLLVCWLQELLYRFYQQHFYFVDAQGMELDLERFELKAVLRGKIWGESLNRNYREVKAATYHALKIERDGAFWRASVILDV